MFSLKAKLAAVTAVAAAGGAVLALAPAALAATTPAPAIANDPNAANGTLSFYNAAGTQVSSGNDLTHLFDYALASTPGRPTATKATMYFAFPDHTKNDSTTWFKSQRSLSTVYPNSAAPAPLNASANPLVSLKSTDGNLAALLPTTTLDKTSGYDGIVQIRVYDSGTGAPQQSSPFWASAIYFDQTANTWQQVSPKVAQATSTTLTANPSPANSGSTVTLTATVSPTAAGTVQFKDGADALGNPVSVDGTGVATKTTNTLAAGSHSLSAVFTPASTADFSGSTGNATLVVNPPATPTSTVLALSGGYATAGSAATLTANVTGPGTTPNGAGSVQFYDNGSASPIAGTVSSPATGTYVLDVPAGFTAGAHSIVAKFTPNDLTAFEVSQSAAQAFTTAPAVGSPCAQTGSQCTDPQSIQATIPVGTLAIDTPYTPANPLDLGMLKLSADASKFDGTATFDNIKVTDTRAGNLPWTAKAISSPLTNGSNHANGVINAQNVGLTGLQVTKGTGFTGTVTTADNPAAVTPVAPGDAGSAGLGGSAAHTIATADKGLGTVTMKGTLLIEAPSSTEAGLYTGTITFTVG